MTAKEIILLMEQMRNEPQRQVLMRFFKTGPGQYGEGDEFLGIKVPQTRGIVKAAKGLPIEQLPLLLTCQWHEVRLCGLLLMVERFESLSKKRLINDDRATGDRDETVRLYLKYAKWANNWDLVDLSAPKILGNWLLLPTRIGDGSEVEKRRVIDALADSECLWEQRMSMVCTWKTSQAGDPSWCLRYAERHLHHQHDLMQKAVGWMLREMGKRVSMELLRAFLDLHAHEMPRTMLRYAIEKMDDRERREWLSVRALY